MRDKHLETAKHSTIDLVLERVETVQRESTRWEFRARGTLSLHGVSREILLPVRAFQNGDALRLTAETPLRMTEYRIRIPTFLFLILEGQVIVIFDVTAKRVQ